MQGTQQMISAWWECNDHPKLSIPVCRADHLLPLSMLLQRDTNCLKLWLHILVNIFWARLGFGALLSSYQYQNFGIFNLATQDLP